MRSRSSLRGVLSGGMLLAGIGVVIWQRLDVFPATLVVLGIASIVAGIATSKGWRGLQSSLWLIGLSVLFRQDILFPGILVLLGLTALMGLLADYPSSGQVHTGADEHSEAQ